MAYGSVNVPGARMATLGQDGKLEAAQRPSLADIQGGSNPSLLINDDFRNPVNRNGQNMYNTSMYSVDMWFLELWNTSGDTGLSIAQDGIRLQNIQGSSTSARTARIYQHVNNFGCPGCTVTFSCLIKNFLNDGVSFPKLLLEEGGFISEIPITGNGIYSITATVSKGAAIACSIGKHASRAGAGDFDITIAAVKLELGTQQTLARQNAAGEWELTDPPDYDLQYALCSQYSPITGEFVGSQHSNPNLLDNWYFLDPINQRGQKEYTGVGHTIDRWYSGIENTKMEVLESGLRLTAEAERNSWWIQKIEGRAQFVNKVCTLSILTADNNLYCLTATLKNQNATNEHYDRIFSWGVLVWQFYGANEDTARFVIYPNMNETITLIAAKLELGPVQTLAHKEGDNWVLNDPPPNKALELRKCHRYLQAIPVEHLLYVIWPDKKKANTFIAFSEMRANPTILNPEESLTLRNANGVAVADASFTQSASRNNIQLIVMTETTVLDKSYYIASPDNGTFSLLSAEL